jgi:hypothetical protein
MAASSTVAAVDGAATLASLPPPPTTMATTLTLTALALTLPWTRIGQRGGGRAVMHLIHRRHGHRIRLYLCLHLRDDGAKDDCHADRRGRHADIRSREEVEHRNAIGMEQQKQKQKQTQTQNQLQWRQCHHLCACRQLCPCSRRCCLCVSRGSSGGSTRVVVAAACPLRVSYSQRHLCNHNPLQKSVSVAPL